MLAGILSVILAAVSMALIAATTSARLLQPSWMLLHTGAFGAVLLIAAAFFELDERSPAESAGLAGGIAAVWATLIAQFYGFAAKDMASVLVPWVCGAVGGGAGASLLQRDRVGPAALAAGLAIGVAWALVALI